jgi:hypothetical protein
MSTREVVVTDPNFRANEVSARVRKTTKRNGVRGDREGRKMFFGEFHELLVVNTACADQDHAIRSVVGFDVIREVVTLDGQDVCLGAENRPTKRLNLECDGMEVIKNNFFKLLVNFLLLTENDVSLALYCSILKLRVLQYVTDDIDRDWDVLAEALGVVYGLFT